MRLHRTKKFLHSKGNHQQNVKATYGMAENICKPHINRGLRSKIYKDPINSRAKTTKKLILKWAKNLNRHLFQRRHTMWNPKKCYK